MSPAAGRRTRLPGGDLRRILTLVAMLNVAYFGVEFYVAHDIGSVALFADSVDFLEDTAISVLALVALGWSARRRARMGTALAALLLVPGVAAAWAAWQAIATPVPPDATLLAGTGAGALAVNLYCAVRLARVRTLGGSLTRAAFLSARNDALANVAIIGAGVATAATLSPWPDLIVGLGILAINLDAARDVLAAARQEAGATPAERPSGRAT